MLVLQLRAGSKIAAELVLQFGGNHSGRLQNLQRQLSLSQVIEGNVSLSCRTTADLFEDLILADGLHARTPCGL